MSDDLYLAYGSNLYPPRLRARIGEIEFVSVCRLPGYHFAYNKVGSDGSAKANVTAESGALSWGVIWRIFRHAWPALDRFEGVGRGYERVGIEIDLDTDGGALAQTYIAPDAWQSTDLVPYSWYRDLVVAGAGHWRFPGEYLSVVRDVPVRRDPDLTRHREHELLIPPGDR